VAAVATADAQHAGQRGAAVPAGHAVGDHRQPFQPARTFAQGKQAGMAEGGSSGGDRDAPAAATAVPSGHEAMRTARSRNPVSVARLSGQTTLIGHNDTLPEP
jgi:hypothetical protein